MSMPSDPSSHMLSQPGLQMAMPREKRCAGCGRAYAGCDMFLSNLLASSDMFVEISFSESLVPR